MTSHSRVSETNNLAFGKNCLGRNCQHLSLRPNSSLKSTIVVDNDKGRQDNVDRDSKQRREQNKVLPRGKQTHTKLSPLSLESYNNIGRRQRIARQADLTSGDSKGKSHNHVVNSNVYHEAKPRHKQYQQLRNRQELAIPIHGLNQIITKRPFVSTTPQTFRKRDNHNNELKLSIGVHESVTGVGNVNLVSSGKKLDKAYKGESRYAQPQKLMSSAILFANENEIPIWLLYFLVTLVVVTIICLLASLFGCCLWLCLRFGKRGVGKSSDWSSSSSSLEPKPTKKEKKKRRDRKDKHLFDFDVESTDFDKNKNHDGRRKHLSRNMTIANLYPSNQVEKNLTLGNQSINNTNKLELYSVNWNDNHSLERINEKQLLKQNMKWLGRSNLLQKSKFKFHEQLANKRNSQNTSLDDEREESSTNIDNNINQQTIDGVKKLGSLNYKLDYDFTSSKLSVCIVRATNLAAMDLNGFSDPFVKIYLTPDKKKKYETRVHRKTLNPIFEETYQITIPYSELMTTVLVLTVCDYDRFSKNDIIGELRIPMSSVDLTQVVDEWQDLKSAKDSEDQVSIFVLTCKENICFLPKNEFN